MDDESVAGHDAFHIKRPGQRVASRTAPFTLRVHASGIYAPGFDSVAGENRQYRRDGRAEVVVKHCGRERMSLGRRRFILEASRGESDRRIAAGSLAMHLTRYVSSRVFGDRGTIGAFGFKCAPPSRSIPWEVGPDAAGDLFTVDF